MNILDHFPVVKEHRKMGTLVERMLDKGFNGYQVHLYMTTYDLGLTQAITPYESNSIFKRLQNEEDLHILLDFTKPNFKNQ